MITIDYIGGEESEKIPKLITLYMNSPLADLGFPVSGSGRCLGPGGRGGEEGAKEGEGGEGALGGGGEGEQQEEGEGALGGGGEWEEQEQEQQEEVEDAPHDHHGPVQSEVHVTAPSPAQAVPAPN